MNATYLQFRINVVQIPSEIFTSELFSDLFPAFDVAAIELPLLGRQRQFVEGPELVQPHLGDPPRVAGQSLLGSLRVRINVLLLVNVPHFGTRHDLHLTPASPHSQRELDILAAPNLKGLSFSWKFLSEAPAPAQQVMRVVVVVVSDTIEAWPGIKPGTFSFISQHSNHLATVTYTIKLNYIVGIEELVAWSEVTIRSVRVAMHAASAMMTAFPSCSLTNTA